MDRKELLKRLDEASDEDFILGADDALVECERLVERIEQDLRLVDRIEELESGIRQIQDNYSKRGLIKRLTSQLLKDTNV